MRTKCVISVRENGTKIQAIYHLSAYFFKLSSLTVTSHFQKHSSCLWLAMQHSTDVISMSQCSVKLLCSVTVILMWMTSQCYEDTHTFLLSLLVTSVCSYNSILSYCSKRILLQHLPIVPYK